MARAAGGTLTAHLHRSVVMRFAQHLRLIGTTASLGAALLASTGCQSRPLPSPTPVPAPVPEATSLFVRNFTGFDVAVYVVPRADAKPVWVTTVPIGSSRSLSLKWSDLQADGGLVVRTQILGSSKTWTSAPLIIDNDIVGVLDLKTDNTLTLAGSVLRGVTVQAFGAAMR
jgi:hypothetical protein